jgi:hypothetical protein
LPWLSPPSAEDAAAEIPKPNDSLERWMRGDLDPLIDAAMDDLLRRKPYLALANQPPPPPPIRGIDQGPQGGIVLPGIIPNDWLRSAIDTHRSFRYGNRPSYMTLDQFITGR